MICLLMDNAGFIPSAVGPTLGCLDAGFEVLRVDTSWVHARYFCLLPGICGLGLRACRV